MLAVTDQALTLGGFVALISLGLGAVGIAASAASKNTELRERLAKLETKVEDHLRNGIRHESD